MNELARFAGAGGGILGGQLLGLGWRTVCAVENDPYARDVLMARQNGGCLEAFPIWGDVCTFDGRPWKDRVDVVSGGFPCQDISSAGQGAGIEGDQSGLWSEMARIIGEVRPRFVFVENSPVLTSRGLGTVLGDLASLGFDAEWGVMGANARPVNAPHRRERIWIVARHSDGESTLSRDGSQVAGLRRDSGSSEVPDADSFGKRQAVGTLRRTWRKREPVPENEPWSPESEPRVVLMDDGVAIGRTDLGALETDRFQRCLVRNRNCLFAKSGRCPSWSADVQQKTVVVPGGLPTYIQRNQRPQPHPADWRT
ncbi:MAG: DNA cytosine methyltransferase [bacterium]|nr:DNA cytosine methyltransferase [bacterium]